MTILEKLREFFDGLARDIAATAREHEVLKPIARKLSPHRGIVIPLSPREAIRSDSKRVLVEGNSIPYWQERGWTQMGWNYEGQYKTRFASCAGRVTVSPAGYCKIFVKSPPVAVQRHPKWVCFHLSKENWYRVNTVSQCRDVSSGILEVENIITESYEEYH
jgi:hypothetical protein